MKPGPDPCEPGQADCQAAAGYQPAPHKLVLAFLILACSLRGEIVDRIAVSVGNRVITTSDLDRQIRVAAFLNGTKPDESAAARRTMAERMVEQTLIRTEFETSNYPVPDIAEMEPEFEAIRAKLFPNPADYAHALAEAGITEQDLKTELLWQRTLSQFLDMRFRPGVQVSEGDVQQYFNTVVAPLARAAHPDQPVKLDEYRLEIETKLTGDRADKEMDKWLVEARKRTPVVFHDEVFQ